MMHNDVIFNDDSAMSHDKGNTIIEEILSCISGKGLTVESAKYLLDETAKEILSVKGLDEQKLP